ncbi:MAG: hypothetical protein ACFCU3_09005, partial [Verrucomicrobiales bacterium]
TGLVPVELKLKIQPPYPLMRRPHPACQDGAVIECEFFQILARVDEPSYPLRSPFSITLPLGQAQWWRPVSECDLEGNDAPTGTSPAVPTQIVPPT